jgi:hypothetical protein
MTSAKQIAANRKNAAKTTGPRTARGKLRSRSNALRHGLAAVALMSPAVSAEIKLLAQEFCSEPTSPLLYEQALIIAENQILLRMVRHARVAVLKRMRACAPAVFAEIDPAARKSVEGEHRERDLAEPNSPTRHPEAPIADAEAVRDALCELARLDRYDRRARSGRNQAIRKFKELDAMIGHHSGQDP